MTFEDVSSSEAFTAALTGLSFRFSEGGLFSSVDWASGSWSPADDRLEVSSYLILDWERWVYAGFDTGVGSYVGSHYAPSSATYEHGHWALAPDPHDVEVFGGPGNDTIYGQGNQLLSGDDTVRGGEGAQLLMGGDGCDRVEAGHSNETLLGGGGRDVFAFANGVHGAIVIEDFTPGQDRIEVACGINGKVVDAPRDLALHVSGDMRGNAVLDLGGGAIVTLSHVSVRHVESHVQDRFKIV